MTMRIIAGAAKGRRLAAPPGTDTRPLTGRMRESMFSALGVRVVGARVLDLYAGTGSAGLEALSRGAEDVTFVEADPSAAHILADNVERVGLGGRLVVATAEHFVSQSPEVFDIVFVDPPYAMDDEAVERLLASVTRLVAEAGAVLVHRPRASELAPTMLQLRQVRRYGDARVWWFEPSEETS